MDDVPQKKNMTRDQLNEHLILVAQREDALVSIMKEKMPDFVALCNGPLDTIILHQDAFAAAYQEEEYLLLGKCIKYAGLCGRSIQIVGSNRSTT
jgi:hypothetical protein